MWDLDECVLSGRPHRVVVADWLAAGCAGNECFISVNGER